MFSHKKAYNCTKSSAQHSASQLLAPGCKQLEVIAHFLQIVGKNSYSLGMLFIDEEPLFTVSRKWAYDLIACSQGHQSEAAVVTFIVQL